MSIPAGLLETVPCPITLTEDGSPVVNDAVNDCADWIVNTQVLVPWFAHGPPVHWKNAELLLLGVSVTVTTVPLSSAPDTGVGLIETLPEPDGETLIATFPVNVAVIVAGTEMLGLQSVVVPEQPPPPLQPAKTFGGVTFLLIESPAPGPAARQSDVSDSVKPAHTTNDVPAAQAICPVGPTAFTWMFGQTFAPIVSGT